MGSKVNITWMNIIYGCEVQIVEIGKGAETDLAVSI